ncbi:MAG: DEAD/DEAH box helicase [bacterium]|nr:DEAD/DEAH box helicase [bacterium]
MYVLHAIWLPWPKRRLAVWAEKSEGVRRGRRRRSEGGVVRWGMGRGARMHPFALDRDRLEVVIFNVYAIAAKHVGAWGWCTLYLPTTGEGPEPSPELVLEEGLTGEARCIAPWRVPVLLIKGERAGDFLRSLPYEPPRGVVYGGATRYWEQPARWVLELVSRQCVVPGVVECGRGRGRAYEGRWLVVYGASDVGRVDELARAMPGVCRAWRAPGEEEDPLTILRDFLDCAADGFIRERLYEHAEYSRLPERRGRGVLLEQQWLAALTSERAELRGGAEELGAFARACGEWLAPVRAESRGPFRACFKLEAPEPSNGESETWRVRFYLQAWDDPSVLISAEEIWRTGSGTLTYGKRVVKNPHEQLLGSLGAAARLFPQLNTALAEAQPVSVAMDTGEAYEFLRSTAPVLEQSGYGILLPAWWRAREERLSIRLHLKPVEGVGASGTGRKGAGELLAFDWQCAIGDEVLSEEEFKRIAGMKRALVPIRGRWVELEREQIEQAMRFFERQRVRGGLTLAQALRIGLGGADEATGLPVTGMTGEDWVGEALESLGDCEKLRPIEAPRDFEGRLRPYQARGVAWLEFLGRLGFGACLADDMGLGKTIEVLAFLLHERGEGRMRGPWLIVCPMSVVSNWRHEMERFAPSLRVLVHHGVGRQGGEEFVAQAGKHDVVLTTYGLVQRDIGHLRRVVWEGVVLDEAQNIKNTEAKQTQAARELQAGMRIALTGTPVENRLTELWSIMEFLNPGYLGSAGDFHVRFTVPIERHHDMERAAVLRRLIQPFVLRRVKTDKAIINDLPEKMEVTVLCNLTREQAALYEAVVEGMLERIGKSRGIERKGLILAALTKLKQVCNHPAQFLGEGGELGGRSGKLTRLEEMLEEAMAEGDKALVFTQYAEMGKMLKRALQERFGREVLFLHGGTKRTEREAMVARFESGEDGPAVFILTLKAGGVGLNLTAATRVFHYDRWWNPAVEDQATDRVYRIGQRRQVYVYKFVCAGTVEEGIARMIEGKKELAERVVGVGEEWITELSTEALGELFKLRREAVMEG